MVNLKARLIWRAFLILSVVIYLLLNFYLVSLFLKL